MRRPRLFIVSVGGAEPEMAPEELGTAPACHLLPSIVPALSAIAEFDSVALLHVPSASLSPAHLVEVAQRIEDALATGCDGAVVVHGADTIEESAFILDLLVGSENPVVVAAMSCNGNGLGPLDAARLAVAVAVAAAPEARGLGALVVAKDEIHAARFAQLSHARQGAAFVSPLTGPIGIVVEGRPRFWARVARLPCFPAYGGPPRQVALLRWTMGDDGRWLGSLPMLGYAGAVIEGMGAGHVPMEAMRPLGELAARMPVVLASRSSTGLVVARKRPGTDLDLLRLGLIPAGWLSGLKARLLLGLALRGGTGHAAAAAAFAHYQ
ncbi:asparaginase domain-containing protein [Falsiroseomonas sp.]|uniref:asparaginase domain-containing protein n=1 Tax=Falsiroseomonas sp. TaxID=2870721 RepID=UPI0027247B41|nr:asparaginase domain-containing protein [Falsiroseomonas sp.]MDO9503044.1 asparaginase domain-containing protein [Falsiroseomonas sp.]